MRGGAGLPQSFRAPTIVFRLYETYTAAVSMDTSGVDAISCACRCGRGSSAGARGLPRFQKRHSAFFRAVLCLSARELRLAASPGAAIPGPVSVAWARGKRAVGRAGRGMERAAGFAARPQRRRFSGGGSGRVGHVLHQFARRQDAVRRIFSFANSCHSSNTRTGCNPGEHPTRSRDSPWAVTALCGSRLPIRKCSVR